MAETVCTPQDVLWWTLYQAEGALKGSWLRRKALAECMRHIHYEVQCEATCSYLSAFLSCPDLFGLANRHAGPGLICAHARAEMHYEAVRKASYVDAAVAG